MPPVPIERRASHLSATHRQWIAGYLFVLPDSLGLILFVVVPMALSFGLGFFEADGFGGYSFVGLANYERMVNDPLFLQSLQVTLTYVVLLVPALFVAGLGLALLVQRSSRLNGVFRTMLFTPQIVSLVVVAMVWQLLLVDKVGPVNRLLAVVGLGGISWLGDPRFALFTIVAISVWFLMGFYMLVFLGGLQDIPEQHYEAARLDGAGPVTSFVYITLPLLRPTSFFVLLVSSVTAICGAQTFDLVYVMTKGGPANSTALAIYDIYQEAFLFNDFGYAAALASCVILILLVLTLVLFLLTRGGRFIYD